MADEESKNVDQNNAEDKSENETKTEESVSLQDDVKETKQSNDKSSTKPKTPVKEKKAKKESKKQEKEESEDESDDEELVGILDAPLVVEGKRIRKSTEFLSNSIPTPQSGERKKIEVPQGKGEVLGNMPRVQFQLGRIPADELKPLHKLLFGRAGSTSEVKKNIRLFNGFNIEKGSQEYKKKEEQVDRFTMDSLRRLCEILDVEKKAKKEEMLENIMDFLLLPKASGKAVKEPSKKGSASKKTGSKRKRKEKEKEGSSKKKKSDEIVESDGDSDDEEKEPPAKKAKSPSKSTAKSTKKEKKESKKPAKKEKKVVSIKISPGKKAKKAKEKKEDSGSSDDEPLIKRAKKTPPTNKEILELVKELLDGADLEKITMKSVCKQVYERFPDFDLTDRKEFIKDSVKEIIT